MKVKVRDYEGTLVSLERQWTHEYAYNTDRYSVTIMVDKDSTVNLVNVTDEDIKFVEE